MSERPRDCAVEMHRIVREGAVLAGGARAILLQIANPGVGEGVSRHSDFAYRPLDRLRTTLTYIFCVTYGTEREVEVITKLVTQAHAKVRGPGYNALDPELQLWVAATLYDTATLLYERIFGPLDDETAERIYQEYALLGTALQVPPSLWPADRKAFRKYWDEMVATAEVTDHARAVAHDLLHNKSAPPWLRAALPFVRFITTGMLPPSLRCEYGLSWDERKQRRYDLLMDGVALVYPRLPMVLRELPKTYYLRKMRKWLVSGRPAIAAE